MHLFKKKTRIILKLLVNTKTFDFKTGKEKMGTGEILFYLS